MNRLWAPWRIKYIQTKKQKKCIFCKRNNYVILKTRYSSAMLNIFPYNNGHVMISPLRHVKDTCELKETEILDLVKTLNEAKRLLDKVLKPQGYNIGINMAAVAGAGITGHLHIHLVPRWQGDTNFMPLLTDTKVISQSLDGLYQQLKYVLAKTKQTTRR